MAKSNGSAASVLAGLATVLGLGFAWAAVFANLPSPSELKAGAQPNAPPSAEFPVSKSPSLVSSSEHPSVQPSVKFRRPSLPPSRSDEMLTGSRSETSDGSRRKDAGLSDPRRRQIAELKCEAELERRCAGSSGSDHPLCVEEQVNRLPQCQVVRERIVRWKEERARGRAACDEDVRRFCRHVQPGGGRVIQCLVEHAQEVSERCHETLPKGSLMFKN